MFIKVKAINTNTEKYEYMWLNTHKINAISKNTMATTPEDEFEVDYDWDIYYKFVTSKNEIEKIIEGLESTNNNVQKMEEETFNVLDIMKSLNVSKWFLYTHFKGQIKNKKILKSIFLAKFPNYNPNEKYITKTEFANRLNIKTGSMTNKLKEIEKDNRVIKFKNQRRYPTSLIKSEVNL